MGDSLSTPWFTDVQAQVDPFFGLQQDLSEEEPLTLSVDPENVIELSAENVQVLTYENLVDIWRVSSLWILLMRHCWKESPPYPVTLSMPVRASRMEGT